MLGLNRCQRHAIHSGPDNWASEPLYYKGPSSQRALVWHGRSVYAFAFKGSFEVFLCTNGEQVLLLISFCSVYSDQRHLTTECSH